MHSRRVVATAELSLDTPYNSVHPDHVRSTCTSSYSVVDMAVLVCIFDLPPGYFRSLRIGLARFEFADGTNFVRCGSRHVRAAVVVLGLQLTVECRSALEIRLCL